MWTGLHGINFIVSECRLHAEHFRIQQIYRLPKLMSMQVEISRSWNVFTGLWVLLKVLNLFQDFPPDYTMHCYTFDNAIPQIDGVVQDCSISIANALEILQSCTIPSICY